MNRIIFKLMLMLVSPALFASDLEKSRIKAEQSFLGKNEITYQGNVSYEHSNLSITADKLVRENKTIKKIIVTGNPVKVFYRDQQGEATEIFAPRISYWEDSGKILADGPIDIKQTSKQDRLKLSGNELVANRKVAVGFSFTLIGSPTQFHLQQPNQPLIEATADQLSSNGKGRQTQLTGNVKLRQGDSYMAAASMTYDGEKQIVSAQQSQDGTQRVETEFYWDQEDKKPTEKDEEQPES